MSTHGPLGGGESGLLPPHMIRWVPMWGGLLCEPYDRLSNESFSKRIRKSVFEVFGSRKGVWNKVNIGIAANEFYGTQNTFILSTHPRDASKHLKEEYEVGVMDRQRIFDLISNGRFHA